MAAAATASSSSGYSYGGSRTSYGGGGFGGGGSSGGHFAATIGSGLGVKDGGGVSDEGVERGFGGVDEALFVAVLVVTVAVGVYHGAAGSAACRGRPTLAIRRKNLAADVAFLFTSYMSMAIIVGEWKP